MSGLLYEVIWARQLTLVFGATSPAITTVLTTFMLGLAAGSHAAGRWAHRWGSPLHAYAGIELAIAAYALTFPILLKLLPLVHVPLFRLLVENPLFLGVARVAFAGALLLPPTLLMGASLPVLARGLIRGASDLGPTTGVLYGLNTLGAAVGVYAASFFLIPQVGLVGGTLAAAGLNVAIAAVAWKLSDAAAVTSSPAVHAGPSRRWLFIAYGLSGLAALGL